MDSIDSNFPADLPEEANILSNCSTVIKEDGAQFGNEDKEADLKSSSENKAIFAESVTIVNEIEEKSSDQIDRSGHSLVDRLNLSFRRLKLEKVSQKVELNAFTTDAESILEPENNRIVFFNGLNDNQIDNQKINEEVVIEIIETEIESSKTTTLENEFKEEIPLQQSSSCTLNSAKQNLMKSNEQSNEMSQIVDRLQDLTILLANCVEQMNVLLAFNSRNNQSQFNKTENVIETVNEMIEPSLITTEEREPVRLRDPNINILLNSSGNATSLVETEEPTPLERNPRSFSFHEISEPRQLRPQSLYIERVDDEARTNRFETIDRKFFVRKYFSSPSQLVVIDPTTRRLRYHLKNVVLLEREALIIRYFFNGLFSDLRSSRIIFLLSFLSSLCCVWFFATVGLIIALFYTMEQMFDEYSNARLFLMIAFQIFQTIFLLIMIFTIRPVLNLISNCFPFADYSEGFLLIGNTNIIKKFKLNSFLKLINRLFWFRIVVVLSILYVGTNLYVVIRSSIDLKAIFRSDQTEGAQFAFWSIAILLTMTIANIIVPFLLIRAAKAHQ